MKRIPLDSVSPKWNPNAPGPSSATRTLDGGLRGYVIRSIRAPRSNNNK